MNNINEMLDILALSEAKGKIYLEDIMEKFSCSKRTAYRRIEEIMQVLPVEKDDYNKSSSIVFLPRKIDERPSRNLPEVFFIPFLKLSSLCLSFLKKSNNPILSSF